MILRAMSSADDGSQNWLYIAMLILRRLKLKVRVQDVVIGVQSGRLRDLTVQRKETLIPRFLDSWNVGLELPSSSLDWPSSIVKCLQTSLYWFWRMSIFLEWSCAIPLGLGSEKCT